MGNYAKSANDIRANTVILQRLAANSLTLKTLFDTNINPFQYYRPFVADQFNKGLPFDQL